MLLTLLESGFSRSAIIGLLVFIPVMLISLPAHEVAHGWVASRMGDPTARNLGRLTLNPAKHLDPIGFLMMLILGIGWAKPVPINTRNFENPRKGMALTALAGPLTNLIISFVSEIVSVVFYFFVYPKMLAVSAFVAYMGLALQLFLDSMAYYNAALCVFNLIPIPPLDGSRILGLLLPAKWYWKYMKYERYIMYGFLALVFILSRRGISLISYPADAIINLFDRLIVAVLEVFV